MIQTTLSFCLSASIDMLAGIVGTACRADSALLIDRNWLGGERGAARGSHTDGVLHEV